MNSETNEVILSPPPSDDNGMQMAPIPRIEVRPQVRKKRDPEKQARLNASVALHGILQPLLVKKTGEDFVLLAGEGRLIAAKAAGLTQVPVKIWQGELKPGQREVLALNENDCRSELSEAERFQAVMEIWESNPEWSGKEMARQLSESPVTISKMLKIKESYVPVGMDAFFSGRITFNRSYEIASECDLVQHELIRACLNGEGATRAVLQTISRKARNTTPQEKVNKVRCVMDGGIVQISGKDLDLETALEVVSAWLKRARKALEAGWDAKTLEQACRAEAGA